MDKETDGLDTTLEWRNGGWYIKEPANRDVILADILRRVKDMSKGIEKLLTEKEEK